MLRVAEQYAATDTGRQRRANEDALLARTPLFVVADGMGGAQAGEVAAHIAVDHFRRGLRHPRDPEHELAELARAANARIHERSHSHSEQAGMGTTLTAIYVGEEDVSIAHVGDSRAYCMRGGQLMRLTDDHSLVDELMRQGRLTPQEAEEHPQRSVITRALGPEGTVEVDTRSFRARAGDLYLICSDGLTSMVGEDEVASVLGSHERLSDAGEALIAAANAAGGRDNITVVLVRLEEVGAVTARSAGAEPAGGAEDTAAAEAATGATAAADGAAGDGAAGGAARRGSSATTARGEDLDATMVGAPAVGAAAAGPPVAARVPRRPGPARARSGRGRARARRVLTAAAAFAVIAVIVAGGYAAMRSVYFIGTNDRGLVTLYRGLPLRLPGVALYSSEYVSGVSAATLPAARRHSLLDHSLRSEGNAAQLIRSLELGQLE